MRLDAESRQNQLAEVDKAEAISLHSEAQEEEAAREGRKQRQPFFNFEQITKKVVDNIQVTIKNVHVRIEDWWIGRKMHEKTYNLDSGSGLPDSARYAVGITLSHLHVRTLDGGRKKNDEHATIRRQIDVRSLALYWDAVDLGVAATPIDLSDRRTHEEMKNMVEDETDVVSYGKSSRHNFVISPCSLKCSVEQNSPEAVAQAMVSSHAARSAGFREGTVPAELNVEVNVATIDISLDEGQYASLVSWQCYLEWYSRCVRYRASGLGHVNCKRPDEPPVSSAEAQRDFAKRKAERRKQRNPGTARRAAASQAKGGALGSAEGSVQSSNASTRITGAPGGALGRVARNSVGAHAAPPPSVASPAATKTSRRKQGVGKRTPQPIEPEKMRSPNAGSWWRYAASCIIFDLGHKSGGRAGYALRGRTDRRRYVELFKNCRGRPWRPAITFLPAPEDRNGNGNGLSTDSSRQQGSSSDLSCRTSCSTSSWDPCAAAGGVLKGWEQQVTWSGSKDVSDGRTSALVERLRLQKIVQKEFDRIEATMSMSEVLNFRKVSMLQLAFEDDQIEAAFGGTAGHRIRLDHIKSIPEFALGEAPASARSSQQSVPGFGPGASLSELALPAASAPGSCVVTVRMAAMLNTSLKTYCRIAIASTSGQIDPGKCARTCWTPDGCALSEPIWDETFTLSYNPAEDKLIHLVIFEENTQLQSWLGNRNGTPIGELMISLTAVERGPGQFEDDLWPYNVVKAVPGLGAMESGEILPTIGALFLTVQLYDIIEEDMPDLEGHDEPVDGVRRSMGGQPPTAPPVQGHRLTCSPRRKSVAVRRSVVRGSSPPLGRASLSVPTARRHVAFAEGEGGAVQATVAGPKPDYGRMVRLWPKLPPSHSAAAF